MGSHDSMHYDQRLNGTAEHYWTSLITRIEERQDLRRLSSTTTKATKQKSPPNSISHFQLRVENVVLNRVQVLVNNRQKALRYLLLSTWHFVLHTFCYSAQTLVGVLKPSPDSDFTVVVPSLVNHDPEHAQTFNDFTQALQRDFQVSRSQAFGISSELDRTFKSLLDNVFVYCENMSDFEVDWIKKFSVPLALTSLIGSESVQLRLVYASEEFQQQDMAQLLNTFVHILRQVTVDPELGMDELTLISPAELNSIQSQGARIDIPLDKTMLTLFEEQVARVPNNVALICEGKQLSYAELNSKANQLAHLLSTLEVKQETIIALCFPQSELIEISIFAVWKAGAAYVAIDPTFPADRKSYILQDTAALLVLTDAENIVEIQKLTEQRAVLNVESTDLNLLPRSKPRGFPTNGDSLSHVVYTSGTTGKPKGVLTLHRALVNHCLDYPQRYDLSDDEVIPLMFNYVFNAFSEPLTLALANGFPLLIVRKNMLLESEQLQEYMYANKVTHIDATPSLLARLDLTRIKTLRRVVPGGEILTREVYSQIRNSVPSVKIYNVYGNSEGTLCTMTSVLSTYENAFQRPVINKQCFVLSSHLNLLPVNAVGELCLSGIGVARGYLNNDKLTRARFVDNPYWTQDRYHSKLFRTGDLGRRLAGGSIEYLGRKDLQIKIRGFRVELGEIESAIRDYPGVTESAVIASAGLISEEIVLSAFYVLEVDSGPEAIRAHIRKFLPDYMIPSKIIRLPEMPLTANGKIDRMSLSKLVLNVGKVVVQQVEAQEEDALTERVRRIWAECLGVASNSLDVEEDFFDLGGTSLIALAIGHRLGPELGIDIDGAFLYNNSTVAEFAESLRDVSKV